VGDPGARAEVAAAWGLPADALPKKEGRGAYGVVEALLTAAARAAEEAADSDTDDDDALLAERIDALLLGTIDYDDFTEPARVRAAVASAGFVVQLTSWSASVEASADVVLPVKVLTERSGSFTNWEGRPRRFGTVFRQVSGFTDSQVLALLAREMGTPIGTRDDVAADTEFDALGLWTGEQRPDFAPVEAVGAATPAAGEAVLATWRHLLDDGASQSGEPHLAATRRSVTARISAGTAAEVGIADGDTIVIASEGGSIRLPAAITDLPDRVVWLPTYSPGSHVHDALRVTAGAVVRLLTGGA
jgi:NADH-quinone oxidoreductase subunit G